MRPRWRKTRAGPGGPPFDLVLADHHLPSFDGVCALRMARERRPDLPFIFVSGTPGEEVAAEAMRNGATDYVLKQRLGRLVPSVRRALREARERRELQQIQSELRRSEQRCRLLIENATEYAVIVTDPRGHVVTWSAGAEKILGFGESQMIGGPADRIFTPEDLAAGVPEQEMRTADDSGRAEDERWHVRNDGSRFWASGVMTPLRDGRLEGFLKILRDVTEKKRHEESLEAARLEAERAREAAEAANRSKDEFLATVSHELRTPLTAMLGWARMLRGHDIDRATLEEGLETIERNANAQAQLIEDLLDISRIVTGKLRLNVRPSEIVPVVHEAIDSVRLAADAKGIRLRLIHEALGHGGGLVHGDPDRLRQVVWNLLTNAIKFTPRGGSVSVKIDRAGSRVRVGVADTGRGIEAEFLPHVFDRFRQADASSTRRHGGLGLGLSICRHLVELHGGTIEAHSDGEGKGATFTVMLPLMPPPPETTHPRRGDQAGGDGGANGFGGERGFEGKPVLAGLRVLVVDDEPDARRLLSAVLERCQAEVTAAASAAEAIAAMNFRRPDVLLSDIGMPGEDGYALIRRIRLLPRDRGGSVPAAALTAYARAEDRQRVLSAGFQAYISKPVEPEVLVSAVARLAGRGAS